MIRFESDYLEGAHPRVLQALLDSNLQQTAGYGEDPWCGKARELIRGLCSAPDADVHFLVGGTQTNTTVIAAALRPHQGVVSADSGHISTHESGAIEACGHKVLPLPSDKGKITAGQIEALYHAHWNDSNHEHTVQPGMVYISNPTESGTLYSKAELTAISEVCRRLSLPLFLDGARMGYGLAAEENDLTLADYAQLCDAFYIGGTKQGALFGEALVLTAPALKKDFRYFIKQHGGMLAKGRLLGLQFCTLLEDGLYLELARHANTLAKKLRDGFARLGYDFLFPSPTNQQYPILPDSLLKKLEARYSWCFWEKVDDEHSAVRFCTSWCTEESAVDALLRDVEKLGKA